MCGTAGEEDVHKMASIIVFSKAYKIAQTFSATYTLVSKQVQGDPVAEAGVLRLTTTTFTREIQSNPEAEIQEPTQFVSGSYKLIEPFDERSGTIPLVCWWRPDTHYKYIYLGR